MPVHLRERLKLNDFAHRGQFRREAKALLDLPRQRSPRLVFTVNQNYSWLARRNGAEPIQQIRLPGMSAETSECVDVSLHGDFFAMDAHQLRAFNQSPSKRIVALVSHDQNVSVRLPEVLLEVMENAAGVAHPRAGH